MQALLTPQMTAREAIASIPSGSTILIGGWSSGTPHSLIAALAESSVTDLTVVYTAVGKAIEPLILAGKVRKVISSFGSHAGSARVTAFDYLFRQGGIELELTPQGTLAERLHAAAAGVPAFYLGTGADTLLAAEKEAREFGGERYVLEYAIRGDYALVHAHTADLYGNLAYRLSSKNFNPVMALAADHVFAEVERLVEPGDLAPDRVDTPACCIEVLVPQPQVA